MFKEPEDNKNKEIPVNDENLLLIGKGVRERKAKKFNNNINNESNEYINDSEKGHIINVHVQFDSKEEEGEKKDRQPLMIEKGKKDEFKKFFDNNPYNKGENLLKFYTSDVGFYKYINEWLRTLDYKIYKQISPIVGKMTNIIYSDIIEKSENSEKEKDILLFRGFSSKKADIFLNKACEGDIICYPAFTSTSEEKEVADEFIENVNIDKTNLNEKRAYLMILKYNIKVGCKYQEADIAKFSKFDESERLFPPFSFFKINEVKFKNKDEDNKNDQEIYDGTKDHPFIINLEVINRNFYLDQAILKNEEFKYNKEEVMWELNNNLEYSKKFYEE